MSHYLALGDALVDVWKARTIVFFATVLAHWVQDQRSRRVTRASIVDIWIFLIILEQLVLPIELLELRLVLWPVVLNQCSLGHVRRDLAWHLLGLT